MALLQKVRDELKKTLNLLNDESFANANPSQNAAPQLQISELVVGGKVEVVNSDGSLSPAPDGKYTVNQDEIVVKDGLIESINGNKDKPAAPNQPAASQSNMGEDFANELADLKAQFEELKASFDELKSSTAELKAAMTKDQEMSADFTKQISELTEAIKTIANTPAEFSKTSTSNVVKDSKIQKEDKMKELASRFASIKK